MSANDMGMGKSHTLVIHDSVLATMAKRNLVQAVKTDAEIENQFKVAWVAALRQKYSKVLIKRRALWNL